MTLKGHHLTPMPVTSSASPLPSTSASSSSLPSKSASYPVIVIPQLVIPVKAYPEQENQPGGKDYLCHMCTFQHSNLDCILTHVRKHLDITISSLAVGRDFKMQPSCTNMERRHTGLKLLHPQRIIESYCPLVSFTVILSVMLEHKLNLVTPCTACVLLH